MIENIFNVYKIRFSYDGRMENVALVSAISTKKADEMIKEGVLPRDERYLESYNVIPSEKTGIKYEKTGVKLNKEILLYHESSLSKAKSKFYSNEFLTNKRIFDIFGEGFGPSKDVQEIMSNKIKNEG